VKDFMMKKKRLFDTELHIILSQNCLRTVVVNETYTILVLSEAQIDIDDELIDSAEVIHTEALSHNKNAHKRLIIENLNLYHVQKRQNARIDVVKTLHSFLQKSFNVLK